MHSIKAIAAKPSTSPNSKRKAENGSVVIPPKRTRFLKNYYRQNFSLPNTVMFYIATNSNPKVYEKMIQTCKYFFVKYPRLVVHGLTFNKKFKWHTWNNQKRVHFRGAISNKIWVVDEIDVDFDNYYRYVLSSFISNIIQCDIKKLRIDNQNIYYCEFLFLSKNVEECSIFDCGVADDDGTIVMLENFLKALPKVTSFRLTFNLAFPNITSKTVQEMVKLSHFSNLTRFSLSKVPDIFDMESFYVYIKGNEKTKIWLSFDNLASEDYKNRLQAIINENVETENHHYRVPMIKFPGQNQSTYDRLHELYSKK
uniref:Uncharacterized protein n=1 Tax=Panagrolaimus davidi TaxID=227884 RepID=A0A914Q8Q5_9BILA